jgi:hypothetical protein
MRLETNIKTTMHQDSQLQYLSIFVIYCRDSLIQKNYHLCRLWLRLKPSSLYVCSAYIQNYAKTFLSNYYIPITNFKNFVLGQVLVTIVNCTVYGAAPFARLEA